MASHSSALNVNGCAACQIDIEGSEYQLLDDFFKERHPMPFSEILIEIHIPPLDKGPGASWGTTTPERMKCACSHCDARGGPVCLGRVSQGGLIARRQPSELQQRRANLDAPALWLPPHPNSAYQRWYTGAGHRRRVDTYH